MSCLTCSNCNRELKGYLDDVMLLEVEQRVLCTNCASQVPDARGPFERVTRLKQYVYLLRVALARLLLRLREGGTLPHTSGKKHLQVDFEGISKELRNTR